jgi:hypothetical protein
LRSQLLAVGAPLGSSSRAGSAGSLGKGSKLDHALVVGFLPGQNQAQSNQREVRRPGSQHTHPLVEGRGTTYLAPICEQRFDDVFLRRLSFEKIPVQQLETHPMHFAARLALLLTFIATATAATRADDLSTLLDRMRARSGPVWKAHLISTSRVSLDGQEAELHSESHDVRFATYQCVENLCSGTYFDGERTFDIDINGTTLPESDATDNYIRGERTIASLAFLNPDFSSNGGHVTDDGLVTISGARYHALLVSNGDATPMQVFVDPRNSLVRYFRDINDDSSFEYRDYRAVSGGYYLPFVVLRNGTVLERYHSRGATSDTFTAPHGPLPVFHGPPAPVPTNPDHAVPMFHCTLGGLAATCLLDSGNSGLAMSRELADALHAPKVGSFQVGGLGNYTTDVVRGGELDVGNAAFPAANYVVLNDIRHFGYDVVLGADVFASTTVLLDPVSHTLSFGAPAPADATSVHIVFQNFLPVVMVHLGAVGTQLAIDTGDESNINLAYDFYTEHHTLFNVTGQNNVLGIGGTSVELIGTIPTVRIGDISLDQQRIGTTQTLHSTAFGHLGASFLAQFNVLIDYANGTAYFSPIRN